MISDDVQSQNQRGRPATGTNQAIGVRIPPAELAQIDAWRAGATDIPTRPEAIRRLTGAAFTVAFVSAQLARTAEGLLALEDGRIKVHGTKEQGEMHDLTEQRKTELREQIAGLRQALLQFGLG